MKHSFEIFTRVRLVVRWKVFTAAGVVKQGAWELDVDAKNGKSVDEAKQELIATAKSYSIGLRSDYRDQLDKFIDVRDDAGNTF